MMVAEKGIIGSSVYDPFHASRYAELTLWYTVTEIETLGMQR
jgi:hypothetical protein